jgi:hypothetical protein
MTTIANITDHAAATAADNVNNRAVLVSFSSSQCPVRKKDKTAARQTTAAAGADADVGSFYKALFPAAYTRPIQQAYNAAYKTIQENTLPYAGSVRCLPLANYDNFTAAIAGPRADFWAAVNTLMGVYGDLLAQAPARLGALYSPRDFYPVEVARSKYSLNIDLLPLPNATPFADVYGLSDGDRARLEKQAADSARAALAGAVKDSFSRLFSVVQDFAETMREDKIFRDSKVKNIVRLLDMLPRLNVTNDSELTARINEARALVRYAPQQLRDNDTARAIVADEADDILAKMAAGL